MELLYQNESGRIRNACFEVFRQLGCGFLEGVYQEALAHEFELEGIPFVAQPELNISYKNIPLKQTYKPDFICFGLIVLELKAVKTIAPEHVAQVLNYLAASKLRLGLLANFGVASGAKVERYIL